MATPAEFSGGCLCGTVRYTKDSQSISSENNHQQRGCGSDSRSENRRHLRSTRSGRFTEPSSELRSDSRP